MGNIVLKLDEASAGSTAEGASSKVGRLARDGNDAEVYNATVITATDEEFRLAYRFQRTIGDGTSASVQRAVNVKTKQHVAVKLIQKKMLQRDSAIRVKNELKAWRKLKHPNICQLYEVYDTPSTYYFVCELAENGDLLEFINNNGFFKETQARKVFAQVLSAVHHCHANGIVHRDMKLENILIDKDGNAKLTDFGFAGFFDSRSDGTRLHEWCGSPPYAAPEIFMGSPYYGPEIDVWSLGVVLFAMCTGTLPFLGDNFELLMGQVLEGKFDVPFFMSMGCESLVRQMIKLDAKERSTIDEVIRHSWLTGIEGVQLAPTTPKEVTSSVTSTDELSQHASSETSGYGMLRRRLFGGSDNKVPESKPKLSRPVSRSTNLSRGSALLLFDCAICEAPSSARWDFTLRSSGICTACNEAKRTAQLRVDVRDTV